MDGSVVWHLSLPLMNGFNKTEAAIFLMQAVLYEGFLFSQLKQFISLYVILVFFVNIQLKDARSVYVYPYNRSQILQYVKYTK